MKVRFWFAATSIAFAVPLLQAQAPRPKPKPEPAPASPRARPEPTKAEKATLLITVDAAATVYIDADELGHFEADAVRTVAVSLGQHLVRAVAGDLKWEQVVNAEKPVQIVVRTGIRALAEQRVAADAAAADAAARVAAARAEAEAREEAARRRAAEQRAANEAATRAEARVPAAESRPSAPVTIPTPPSLGTRELLGYDESTNPLPIGAPGKDVVWVPAPAALAYTMLKAAGVGPGDVVYDLGSGDGRIVIMAAKHFGARGVGIEYNPQLTAIARRNAAAAGVADKVSFRTQDLFEADLSPASVISMFLLPSINAKLRPRLQALRPGTRIVSNTFDIDGWQPDSIVQLPEDRCVSWCTALLWTVRGGR